MRTLIGFLGMWGRAEANFDFRFETVRKQDSEKPRNAELASASFRKIEGLFRPSGSQKTGHSSLTFYCSNGSATT